LERAKVAFLNFVNKVGKVLGNGLISALDIFGSALPALGISLEGVWKGFKAVSLDSVAIALRAFSNIGSVLTAIIVKGAEEGYSYFSKLFGGSFKARDFKVIFESTIQNDVMNQMASNLEASADKIRKSGTTSVKKLVDDVKPQLIALGKTIKEEWESTQNIASVGKDVAQKQARIAEIYNNASERIAKSAEKLVAGTEATTKDLSENVGGVANDAGGGLMQSMSEVIASTLARVGGGGAVGGNIQASLLDIARRQLEETKTQTRAIESRELGVVQ